MKSEEDIRQLLEMRIEDKKDFCFVGDFKRAAAMNMVIEDIKWILDELEK